MTRLLLLILGLSACASEKPDASVPLDLSVLRAKYETYISLSTRHQGDSGFVHDRDCDSLLFSSLYSFAGGEIEVLAAQEEPGKWHRTPTQDCYPDRSKSTISRDMLLGLLYHAISHNEGDISENLIEYGRTHSWTMGDGPRSRTWLNPLFRKTLALLDRKLNNSHHRDLLLIPDIWSVGLTGYQAHLLILHLILRDMISGKIDEMGKRVVREQYQRQPGNALFSFAYHRYFDGDQTRTLNILMDEALFPSDRLPSSVERCDVYLWQRDEPFEPCPEENLEHPGIDFLFVAKLLINTVH